MVKKHDNSWRMCVDFKDLNKAYPKDGYPLPEIDWKVESLCGFPFKCFLDAYKGYHQIQMAKKDEEKIAFITSHGIFCYTKMPFGLRNAGATYQRLVDKAFHKQIGRNLEVYVDDLVIKSRTEDKIVRDIEDTFKTLREINMKLNPKKCTFGVEEGTFLGYKVNTRGLKYAQTRFLAKSAEKSLPFFKTLKKCTKKSDLHWTTEAEEAFKALRGPEINYTSMEKLVLALVHANFIVERPEEDSPDTLMEVEEELPEPWILFTDGSSCTYGSGAVLILTNPEGMEFTYALRFRFDATNNEAEYEALIAGLRIVEQIGVKNLQANVDSRLVANQVNGTYVAKEADMIRYLEKEKSISEVEIMAVVEEEEDTWMTPIFEYLTEEILPADVKKARVVRRKSQQFTVINRTLYQKSFLGPWLRCIGPLQANYVLREIHEGSCSMHAGTRSVVAKALRIVYYWPTMHKEARTLIRACQDCQVHKPVPRYPQHRLTLITSLWPFYKWGIGIAGPFPEGPGKVKFLIVAIDYFTKWIEAKPVATITGNL
ncbi:reverse transcriptase domain-containing protein [Tanacetum coccineum]